MSTFFVTVWAVFFGGRGGGVSKRVPFSLRMITRGIEIFVPTLIVRNIAAFLHLLVAINIYMPRVFLPLLVTTTCHEYLGLRNKIGFLREDILLGHQVTLSAT